MKKTIILTVLAGVLCGFPTASSAHCTSWNFATDYVAAGSALEPTALDTCGYPQWELKTSVDLNFNPATYQPLTRYVDEMLACRPSGPMKSWAGATRYPHVTVNTSATSLLCNGSMTVAPSQVVVHPAPSGAAIVAWVAPFTGQIAVTFSARPIDRGCAGVQAFVQRTTGAMAFDQTVRYGETAQWQGTLDVTLGESIYFGLGPAGYYTYDSTIFDITIDRTL